MSTQRWAPVSLFYPIAFAVIVAMVALALKPGLERSRAWRTSLAAIAAEGLAIGGEQLGALAANERAWSELRDVDGETYAVIGSSGVVTRDDNSGARYWLPADAVVELRGREIDVSLEVRSAPEGGAEEWLARMAIRGVLDTGWLPQRAEAEWSTAHVRLTIPANARYEPMEIIFWADATGDAGRIHLRRIGIDPLGAA